VAISSIPKPPLTFRSRLDLLNAALALQNEADNKEKRARSAKQKKRKPKRDKAKSDKNSSSAYHFIAFVPVGQRVWQLDGLTSTPVCIGKHLSLRSARRHATN
jgi:ubiquitin carboxyl-terminal hydrolase L5